MHIIRVVAGQHLGKQEPIGELPATIVDEIVPACFECNHVHIQQTIQQLTHALNMQSIPCVPAHILDWVRQVQ